MKFDIPGFLSQQTGQGFLIVVGALWLFWQNQAPDLLLWLVAGLGGLYILGEKVRAMVRPEPPDPKP